MSDWIRNYFGIVDRMDMDGYLALHTDEVRFRFANAPTTTGKDPIREGLTQLWGSIAGLRHDIVQTWDTHVDNWGRLKTRLLPWLDQALAALIDDLDGEGLLDRTLVAALGEFGRTPKVNKFGGRDHWPHCFSALLAGAGLPGGAVVGASDREGARPAHRPVSPAELAATLYRLLGLDTNADPRVRPFIGSATAVGELF